MNSWFARGFGNAVAEARHELLGGWFGRNFEPNPVRQSFHDQKETERLERDIHDNDRGLDR